MLSALPGKRFFSVLIFFLIVFAPILRGEDLYFEKRDISAVTIPSVSCLVQDDRGYLWIGTPGGLVRYDGRKFILINQKSHPDLPADRILSLGYDETSDNLWIGTGAGLVQYSLRDDSLKNMQFKNEGGRDLNNEVVEIEIFRNEPFLIASNGIYRLVSDDGIEEIPVEPAEVDDFIEVHSVAVGADDSLWISATDGLKKWNEDSGRFQHVLDFPDAGVISGIGEDIWFAGVNNTVYRFEPDSGEVSRYPGLADTSVIMGSPDGTIWIGSASEGLLIVDPETGRTSSYDIDPEHPNRLPSSRIESMLFGRSGHVWVGTSDSGLLSVDALKENHLEYIRRSGSNGLPTGSVRVLFEDSLGYMWSGSDIGGLARIDPYNGEIRQYVFKSDDIFSVCGDSITGIAEDSSGRLWVGTDQGPCMYLTEVDGFEPAGVMMSGWPDFRGKFVLALTEGSAGRIWVSLKSGELYRLDAQERDYSVFRFTPLSVPSVLHTDRHGTLWAGSRNNIRIFNNDGNLLKTWQPVGASGGGYQEGGVNVIFEDSSGRIWIGTTTGVSRYKGFENGFDSLPFPGDQFLNISDISEDRDGNLWVSDGRQIYIFNPDGEYLTTMNGDVGLTPSGLITSLKLAGDGTMYIGANGEIWTYDSYIEAPAVSDPKVYLTILKVMNSTRALGHELELKSSFKLKADEKLFSIGFGAVDYRFNSEINYQYKLTNFNDEWVDLGGTDTVTFANLPPNHYTFSVRAINDLGQISGNEAVLAIDVERSFWTKPLAVIIYITVFLGLIGLILKLWEARLMKGQIQELEIARLKVIEANKRLSFLTMNDTLTGLLNRRGFDQGIKHALDTSRRNQLMITLIMMDVDFFKLFNDNYGHVQGDEVLRRVGDILRSVFERSTDIIARYGGEEFAVVFIGENPNASVTLANDLICAVKELGILHEHSSVSEFLTLSTGSATIPGEESQTVEDLINLADQALYAAKDGGRDRVCFAGTIPELPSVMKNELSPLTLDRKPVK